MGFLIYYILVIKHLEKAKEQGDKLIVTLTSDKYVNKGPGRPVFNESLRCIISARCSRLCSNK